MFTDNTKLFREIIVDQNDQNLIQEDLNTLFDWSKTWLLKFHPDKCKVLPVSGRNTTHEPPNYTMKKYEGGCTNLENVESEKDIGVTIDMNLSFANHIQNQVNKANQILGLTRRSFVHLDNCTFTLLFKALVRPNLEYANSIWSPYRKADITSIETVQKRATKMLPTMRDLPYEDRSRKLKLPTLRFRRLQGDMIEVYKLLTGLYDTRVTNDLLEMHNTTKTTRGHSMKLMKQRSSLDLRKYFFTNRVVEQPH
ncbi:unnamed protein product [Mytilus coruscus]|uniref:Reverse transcriptase domain-containing protein n=1 Tax=Mytilus coruscus TaxID=42192 RepID=A0A6J8B0T9_MYTCO|nr:unnamed protein product [Mytilus coruscus]